MPKTRLDLVNQCLINLGVYTYGQSLSPEDLLKMDGFIDPSIALLEGKEIYFVADAGTAAGTDGSPTSGEIDDAAFLPLADWIANRACSGFNLAADAKMQALASLAEADLITLSAPKSTLRTLRVDPALRPRRLGWYRG
jgi:hypothetical protein